MKIVKKNFLLTVSIIFIVVTSLLAGLYAVMPVYYKWMKRGEIQREFQQVSQQLKGKSSHQMVELLKKYNPKNNQLWFSLSDSAGAVLYPKIELQEDSDSLKLTILPAVTELEEEENKGISQKLNTSDGKQLTLKGEYSLQPVSDASRVLLNLYPYILFFSLSLGSLAAYLYSRTSSRRIKEISKTTRRMTSLEADLTCSVKGQDEVTALAQDINHLYENLLKSMEALRLENEKAAESEREKAEFLRMTSHELKTPITSVMGMIDGMMYGVGDFKDHGKYLLKCREILEEQAELVQSILAVSKLEMNSQSSEERFSLKGLLEANLSAYQLLAEVHHFHFQYQLEEAEIQGNRAYLLKAVKNLLDNAFHYTRTGGQIVLKLNQGELIIENEAERMLNDQQIQQIFQPFYRPDYSRNRKDGGTGLGLFIVQQILEKHGFSYRFEAIANQWMRFTIVLRVAQPDSIRQLSD